MTEITLSEFAEQTGGKYNTVWRKAKRTFPGMDWNKDTVLSAEQIRTLSGKGARTKATRPKQSIVLVHDSLNQPGPGVSIEAKAPPARQINADWLLDGINYLELAFSVVGFCMLFGWVGLLPGAIACMFYMHSMAVMKRPNAWDTATLARTICFFLAVVFGWVHFNTFRFALDHFRPDISGAIWIAGCFAVLLSGVSLMALYQSNNSKQEQNEPLG